MLVGSWELDEVTAAIYARCEGHGLGQEHRRMIRIVCVRNAGSLRVSVLIEALTRAQRLQTTGMYPPVQLSVFSTIY